MANNNSGKNEKDLVCSFCGKHQDEVERMIIGPGVNICSECIGLCMICSRISRSTRKQTAARAAAQAYPDAGCGWSGYQYPDPG